MAGWCYVFHVWHRYAVTSDAYESKSIGVFSSKRKAEEAIRDHRTLHGFSAHPDGFSVEKRRCNFSVLSHKSQLTAVYLPYREAACPDSDCSEYTIGQFYDDENAAAQCLAEWKRRNADSGKTAMYDVGVYRINQSEWNEGFSSYEEEV